jgi:hypothetical protein
VPADVESIMYPEKIVPAVYCPTKNTVNGVVLENEELIPSVLFAPVPP